MVLFFLLFDGSTLLILFTYFIWYYFLLLFIIVSCAPCSLILSAVVGRWVNPSLPDFHIYYAYFVPDFLLFDGSSLLMVFILLCYWLSGVFNSSYHHAHRGVLLYLRAAMSDRQFFPWPTYIFWKMLGI